MIFRNVELHNIAEVEEQWNGTVLPKRVPEAVRTCLNPSARARCMACANAEVRFVGDGPARITLASGEGRFFHVAYGSFIAPGAYPLTATELTYELAVPENLRQLRPEHRGALPFDPHVIRVLLPRTPVVFRGVEGTNVRPPDPAQVPRIRYLAHGTSITEGGAATAPHLAYAAQTARRLGVDLLNLGMSGSCHAEKEMADHIASRKDWDIATLELSVNMMSFDVDEFRRRVAYMVDTVAGADPSRPVVCLTLYPYFNDFCANHAAGAAKAAAFRQTLRDVVAASPHPNVHLVEGADLLDAVDGLSADMIHPSDYGMSRIAEHLAARLRPLLPSG